AAAAARLGFGTSPSSDVAANAANSLSAADNQGTASNYGDVTGNSVQGVNAPYGMGQLGTPANTGMVGAATLGLGNNGVLGGLNSATPSGTVSSSPYGQSSNSNLGITIGGLNEGANPGQGGLNAASAISMQGLLGLLTPAQQQQVYALPPQIKSILNNLLQNKLVNPQALPSLLQLLGGSAPTRGTTMGYPSQNPTLGVGGTPQGTPAPVGMTGLGVMGFPPGLNNSPGVQATLAGLRGPAAQQAMQAMAQQNAVAAQQQGMPSTTAQPNAITVNSPVATAPPATSPPVSTAPAAVPRAPPT